MEFFFAIFTFEIVRTIPKLFEQCLIVRLIIQLRFIVRTIREQFASIVRECAFANVECAFEHHSMIVNATNAFACVHYVMNRIE